jgi:hypothetical protein
MRKIETVLTARAILSQVYFQLYNMKDTCYTSRGKIPHVLFALGPLALPSRKEYSAGTTALCFSKVLASNQPLPVDAEWAEIFSGHQA